MPFETIGYTAICVVFGIAIIAYGLHQRSRLRASESWQQVMGTILKAEVVDERANDSAEYRVHVLYEYAVNGMRYTGKRIELNHHSYIRKKSAEAQLEQYPLNSSVAVYFNPDKPDEAVLVRTAPHNTLYLVMGILSLGLSLVIVLHYSLRR